MKRGLCVTGIALIALAACGESETGLRVGAYRACERAVDVSLRAPATADYSGTTGSDITNDGDRYLVRGHVDSENGFGANVRTQFTCTVDHTADDNWDLVDLDL